MFDKDKLGIILFLLFSFLMLTSCSSTSLSLEDKFNLKQGPINTDQADKEY